jgi:hypothetical protein
MSPTCRCSREVTEKLCVQCYLSGWMNWWLTVCIRRRTMCGCRRAMWVLRSFPIHSMIYAHFSSSCFCWPLISIQSDVQYGIDVCRSQSDRLLHRSCRIRQSRYSCTKMHGLASCGQRPLSYVHRILHLGLGYIGWLLRFAQSAVGPTVCVIDTNLHNMFHPKCWYLRF